MSLFKEEKDKMNYILITDVGSTTTKARFFHKGTGGWRFLVAGEAPTTVESPYEDVTLGVRNAIREVEELTGQQILNEDGDGIIKPFVDGKGTDLYLTTSSAGGGLQMMVAGVASTMTAESANRAALGAGAIVMDVLAVDDGREDYEKIQRIRNFRPDMILLAGGTDGGTTELVMEIAEIIKSAKVKPRLGFGYKLPLVYAGNKDAKQNVQDLLDEDVSFKPVENIRPVLEVENTEPARRAIHKLFMEHVMSHAPGYLKLMDWTDVDIMPTPSGEGLAMQLLAKIQNKNVLGVGLGGATTNIYSIFENRFVRSVSANLGMSYSICNVLKETGIKNITRWLPYEIEEGDVKNRLRNKMIRPTTIPQTLKELMIEHAVAREALSLGLVHHKSIASHLKGALKERSLERALSHELEEESYVNMMEIDIIAGTGGLLSHAPERVQSMMILIDGFQPQGVTRLYQDSVFMMPHLGLLSTVCPKIAWNIFDKDCLVRLGTVVAPSGRLNEGENALNVKMEMPSGEIIKKDMKFGEITNISLNENETANLELVPHKRLDIGSGKGIKRDTKILGGIVGVIIDTRGRPLILPENNDSREKVLRKWYSSLKLYPSDFLNRRSHNEE